MTQAQLDQAIATKDETDIRAGVVSPQEVRDRRGLKGPAPKRPDMVSIGVTGLEDKKEDQEEEEPEDEA